MASKSAPPIPPQERIPLGQKLAFSIGTNLDWVATGVTTGALWMPFFNIGLGLNPAYLGLVLMIFRAWDAFTDPVMGYISDNFPTRWGRRRPYMALGAVLVAVLYPFLWRPPTWLGDDGKLVWITLFGMVFFTAYTIWSMPYYGLQLELTPNYDERTRLSAWMAVFGKLGVFAGGWILAIVTGPWFQDPATGKADIVQGLQTSSWFIAAFLLVIGLMPALFVKERFVKPAEAAARAAAPREPFWKNIRESLSCTPLWLLIGASFLVTFGGAAVGTLGQYANIYYVNGGDLALAAQIGGWKSSATVVFGLATIPLWMWMGERFDKRNMVVFLIALGMLGHALNFVLMTPENPYLQIIPAIFESTGFASIWLFLPSMKADVADYDELHTARRRESSINAFYSWFFKVALTLSMGVGGLMLALTGFQAKLGGDQAPHVIDRMFHLYLWTPIPIWIVAIGLLLRYHLNRGRMAEIRQELEARRGKI